MKQFDVFNNPSAEAEGFAPYVLLLSSHHIDLDAVLVAPLFSDRSTPANAVEIFVAFDDQTYVLSLIAMTAVAPKALRVRAGSLSVAEDEIRRGLDRLFSGF